MASAKISHWALLVSFSILVLAVKSDEENLRTALINFITSLTTNSSGSPNQAPPWNLSSSDPCGDNWPGVTCDNRNFLKNVTLNGFKFSGTFNPGSLCDVTSVAASLTVLSLNDNLLRGDGLERISNCTQLTRLYLGGNRFLGRVPESFSGLKNLKRLDVSRNNFSGPLPDFSRISGLVEFTAQDNQLSGALPNFEFSNLDIFNVSDNNFSGPIPSGFRDIPAASFMNNPQLCGDPLPNSCQPTSKSSSDDHHESRDKRDKILMFLGYFLLAFALVLLIALWLCRKRKKEEVQVDAVDKVVAPVDVNVSVSKPNHTPYNFKSSTPSKKSEISMAAGENSSTVSSSLVVLTSPEVNGIKFENLLKAPAELLGRGKHGSVYKVVSEELGTTVVVKRIKDWAIPSNDFRLRMRRLDRVQHPNVLSALAFYSSTQEKLLVYEYQQNGSLFKLLSGSGTGVGETLDWSTRLDLAASIADGLAFMHQELQEDGIAHGNLKSTNILVSKNMAPYISEYGLMFDSRDPSVSASVNSSQGTKGEIFKADVYAFGVILLEMLTGKLEQNEVSGFDLASWVVSVVREEWTVEVFDKKLIQEGGNEERMVNLLQIAIKCVNRSPEARPKMNEIAQMLNAIKEDEEKSMDDVSGMTSTSSIFDFERV